MAREYETVFRLGAELDSKFGPILHQANAKFAELDRKIKSIEDQGRGGSFGKGIISGIQKISKAASLAMAGIAAGGAVVAGMVVSDSVSKAMSFESQMSTIQALTGATTKEMAAMQALALKMGADTKYNALEAAQGIEELLKAGISPAAVAAGGLEAALNLATAGGLDLAAAAEIMSTSLNAYKGDGMSAAQASDILAGTANASATSVEELRYSLAMVSAVAAGLGQNFQDTNVALGLFANNGLKGSDAGTSLKTMLMNLIPHTKAEAKLFDKLGVTAKNGSNAFFDAKGNIEDLGTIAAVLQKKLKGLTREQRLATLEQMFGSDAIRAANILYEEGAEGVEKFRKEMSKVTALDVAKKKMDNAAGAVEQFRGAVETLKISALLPTMPLIKKFANAAADFVSDYTPRITKRMEEIAATAKKYLDSKYYKNSDFQNLDLQGKVTWVIDDLGKIMTDWMNSEQAEKIGDIGMQIGGTMISSAASAALKGITESPTLSLLLGAAIGLRSPTPIGVAVALTVTVAPWVLKLVDFLRENSKTSIAIKDAERFNDFREDAKENSKKNPGTPLIKGGEIVATSSVKKKSTLDKIKDKTRELIGYADGGFSNRPAIFGEAGLEAAIPINSKARSHALLEQANRMMGHSSGSTTYVYSPTIQIQGNADEAVVTRAVLAGNEDFRRQADAHAAQQRRVSMI